MKLSTTICVYLLALLMTAQAFVTPIVYLDFKLRQDYITKMFCVNRDKPMTVCNGQCYLMKKIRKAEQKKQAQDNQSTKKQSFETICHPLFHFGVAVAFTEKDTFAPFAERAVPHYQPNIFHPPRQA